MKMLRNRKTGVLFPFTESLLKLNHNMEVYNTDFDKPAVEDTHLPLAPELRNTQASEQELPHASIQAQEPELPHASAQTSELSKIMIGDKSIYDAEKKDLIEYLHVAFEQTLPARANKQDYINKIIELS